MVNLPFASLSVRVSVDARQLKGVDEGLKLFGKAVNELTKKGRRRKETQGFVAKRVQARQAINASRKNSQAFLGRIRNASAESLLQALEEVKDASVSITPKDTGLLRSTAFTVVEQGKTSISGMVGYNIINGNPPPGVETGASYAVEVHETNKPYRVGQWKFLQTAFDQHKDRLATTISGKIKNKLGTR